MLHTLNISNELSELGIKITFVRQPELFTTGPHGKLLFPIKSYFAETERAYISLRTKQGLAAAKARGKQLGQPKESRNQDRVLDPYRDEILKYLEMGLNLAAVMKLINPRLEKPLTYNSYRYFVQHEAALLNAWEGQR
jgi:DNA invertase Pin-like site-specific DNA recombinase